MNPHGTRACLLAGWIAAAAAFAGLVHANAEFPNRPVRLIVPVAPGGGLDTTARAVAQKLSQNWGQQVIADNRPGAAGVLAFDIAIKSVPDGYTLLAMSADHVINSVPSRKRPYDVTRDVTAVSQATALSYLVYTNTLVPFSSFKDLLAHARANPGKLNYGTPGTGSLQHLGWEVISQMTGVRLNHVPYKGGAPALVATIAGEVQIGFVTLASARPHLATGRVRPVAVTSRERMRAVPELPTVAELGLPGYELNQYYGVVVASRVPTAIVRRISAGVAAAVRAPDITQRFEAEGWQLVGSSSEEFAAVLRDDLQKWTQVVKAIDLVLH